MLTILLTIATIISLLVAALHLLCRTVGWLSEHEEALW